MLQKIAFSAALISLAIAAVSDIKTREVPDWLSYSTIFFGIGLRLLFSVITLDSSYLITGILGSIAFLIIALIMFYTGQWGGGDSKLLIGIGALIGLEPDFSTIPLLFIFWMNAIFIGALYGLLYSIYLAFKHKKRFSKQFKKLYSKHKKQRYLLLGLSIITLVTSFFVPGFYIKLTTIGFAFFILAMSYILIFVQAIEDTAMKKLIPVQKLTEGDWIVKDILIDGKYICGPKDLGIDKKQIQKLVRLKRKGKIKKVLIKEGIPFVPGFFLALIVTILFGNWFLYLV